jgi:hypothetical protein
LLVRPILAQVKLAVNERVFFTTPKYQNFITNFRTFNGPMNISMSHVSGSKPARLSLNADNSQGPIDLTLDSQYVGTFDVRTKSSTAQVIESVVTVPANSSSHSHTTGTHNNNNNNDNDNNDDDDGGGGGGGGGDEGHQLHFAFRSNDRVLGWIGDSRSPEQFDRHSLGHVKITNSLSPIRLHWAQLKPSSTSTVRR